MNNFTIEIEIESLSIKGEGIGHHLGKTIYVSGALIGEKVLVTLTDIHQTYAIGLLQKVLISSPKRKEPLCPAFGQCGGCQLMHLEYDDQLSFKRQKVIQALQKEQLGVEVLPCAASALQLGYRNKIQLPILYSQAGVAIGLYRSHSQDIIPIDYCHIQHPLAEKIWTFLRPYLSQITIRYLLIKIASETDQALVTFVSKTPLKIQLKEIADQLLKAIPQVKGVVENINSKESNTILGECFKTISGQDFIFEKLGAFVFKICASSFFQINPSQAFNLYQKGIELADLQKTDIVLDAFCGVGTLSLFAAQKVQFVYGIEYNDEAVAKAKENAQLNNIANCNFLSGPAEKLIQNIPSFDVAFINPPRKGCDLDFLEHLLLLSPRTLIYISCNPSSLAKDLSFLSKKYLIDSTHPFDMFPQTHHVETIACLYKK